MSWFSSSNKKKSKSRSRKKKPVKKNAAPWDPQRTLLGLRWLGLVLLICFLCWGFYASEPYLRAYAADRADVKTVKIELLDAPTWLRSTPVLIEEIEMLVVANISSDPLSVADLDDSHKALQASTWIRKVNRIERVAADHIVISAQYREPAAVVEAGDGFHLIDDQGVRLLATPYPSNARQHITEPIIEIEDDPRALPKTAPCDVGAAWNDPRVTAALELVEYLRDQPFMDQVAAFDASYFDKKQNQVRLVLKIKNGGEVNWGLSPADERPIDIPAELKLMALLDQYENQQFLVKDGKVLDVYVELGKIRAVHNRRETP